MTASKKTTKRFCIGADIKVNTDFVVNAESLEEAVAMARELKVDSFVDILGNHNDSSLYINSIFEES